MWSRVSAQIRVFHLSVRPVEQQGCVENGKRKTCAIREYNASSTVLLQMCSSPGLFQGDLSPIGASELQIAVPMLRIHLPVLPAGAERALWPASLRPTQISPFLILR